MSEIKFLIDAATAARVRDWARTRLERDPHGDGPHGDHYRTTSLYFDTDERDVFHRRHSYGRSKYRVRRYDGQDLVFLERKLKTATRLQKRRTAVTLADLARLGCNNAGASHAAWDGRWFDERLTLRRLRPVCQVSYARFARISMRPGGPVRLTLDADVCAVDTSSLSFTANQGQPILADRLVLELKFPVACPGLFKELVHDFRLTPARASKYRTAASELGLVRQAPTTVAAPDAAGATYA